MTKKLTPALAILILIGALAAARAEERKLFNGVDLTGWDGAPAGGTSKTGP